MAYILNHGTTRTHPNPPEPGRTREPTRIRPNPPEPTRTHQNPPEPTRTHPNLTFSALMQYRPPPPLFISYNGSRSFLKRAPNHAPNHKPPIQFQMLTAWYYISFFLVHGISLIEIGARFKNDLPAIIRNKKRGSDTALAPKKSDSGGFGWVRADSGRIRPGSGGFGWARVGSAGFGWFHV